MPKLSKDKLLNLKAKPKASRIPNKPKNKGGRPKAFKTPADLQAKCDEYFNDCLINKEPTTVQGLAIHLGVIRETIYEWEQNEAKGFSHIIKAAKIKLERYLVHRVLSDTKPTGAIFLLKCNYGFIDASNIRLTDGEGNRLDMGCAAEAWLRAIRIEQSGKAASPKKE